MRSSRALDTITLTDIMQDLEAGRSLPLRTAHRPPNLQSLRRSTLGGPVFLTTYLTARALGRIHPRLARRSLLRLWLTPWVHSSTRRPVTDVTADLVGWSLPAAGRTMHGFAGGTGPTVVLVHGWAGRAADWRHLAHDLIAAGWRVVAPDLPAHGTTTGRTTDGLELSRALVAVLRHEHPAAIIAHSLGFPITMLALEEPVPQPTTVVALAPGRSLARAMQRFGAKAKLRPALITELGHAIAARYGDAVWELFDVDRTVAHITARGLVLHDAGDDEVPIADGWHIADQWPDAHLAVTEGLGHRRILHDERVRMQVVDALQ
ncbi:alpha/beta fold hydrolase [soil metagenome]